MIDVGHEISEIKRDAPTPAPDIEGWQRLAAQGGSGRHQKLARPHGARRAPRRASGGVLSRPSDLAAL